MAFDKGKLHLETYGLAERVMEFEVSSATVEAAALAVGCEEAKIAKTLSFLVEEKPILIVTAGDAKIDNKKYKGYFHAKAKMIPFDQVEALIGHAAGGVCPFGIKEGIVVYLDESLKRFEFVYPACGSGNSAVKLTIPELEMSSNYKEWIDVCKIPEEQQ